MRRAKFVIDLGGVRTLRTLHRRIAAVLPVPDGYGRNFDALYDFLTEWGQTLTIVFANVSVGRRTLRRVCADAVAETPGLEIRFVSTRRPREPAGRVAGV